MYQNLMGMVSSRRAYGGTLDPVSGRTKQIFGLLGSDGLNLPVRWKSLGLFTRFDELPGRGHVFSIGYFCRIFVGHNVQSTVEHIQPIEDSPSCIPVLVYCEELLDRVAYRARGKGPSSAASPPPSSQGTASLKWKRYKALLLPSPLCGLRPRTRESAISRRVQATGTSVLGGDD
jgi:hypothetical protein